MSDETTNLAEVLSEERLLHLLRSTEHDLVERKPKGQYGDWLQTAVAFANSAPIGLPAVLFVGVDNSGIPQERDGTPGKSLDERLESLQKSITDTLDKAYPPINRLCLSLRVDGGGCIAVIIPGSTSRPHFAGKAYVRKGPSTTEASEDQFNSLIAERSSKVYELRKLIGKRALLEHYRKGHTGPAGRAPIQIVDCNIHFLTYESGDKAKRYSVPITRLTLSFDHGSSLTLLETWEAGT